jgi:molecular chaperone GrpE
MYWNRGAQSVRRIPVRVIDTTDNPVSTAEHSIEGEKVPESFSPTGDPIASQAENEPEWQSLALRLQADMDNFRKRQARRADEAILAERERLLQLMLPIADNLARALDQDDSGDGVLQQGVKLTYRELMRLLESEGVIPIEAVGQTFTPDLHEAMATVRTAALPGTVVEELAKGFMMGEKLLRPARVVVAAQDQ